MSDSRKAYYEDMEDYVRMCQSMGITPVDSPYGLHAKWVRDVYKGDCKLSFELYELQDRMIHAEVSLKEAEDRVDHLTEVCYKLQEKFDELAGSNQEQRTTESSDAGGSQGKTGRSQWWGLT